MVSSRSRPYCVCLEGTFARVLALNFSIMVSAAMKMRQGGDEVLDVTVLVTIQEAQFPEPRDHFMSLDP